VADHDDRDAGFSDGATADWRHLRSRSCASDTTLDAVCRAALG
jgi:hypothetical protein